MANMHEGETVIVQSPNPSPNKKAGFSDVLKKSLNRSKTKIRKLFNRLILLASYFLSTVKRLGRKTFDVLYVGVLIVAFALLLKMLILGMYPKIGGATSKITPPPTPSSITPTIDVMGPPIPPAISNAPPHTQNQGYVQSLPVSTIQSVTNSSGNDFKELVPILSIIFAVLGGTVLKFARDAVDDIKKQSDAAKMLEKQKLLFFHHLRSNLNTRVAISMASAGMRFNANEQSNESWKNILLLDELSRFYELADAFGTVYFDPDLFINHIDTIIGSAEEEEQPFIDLLRESPRNREYLELMVELAQPEHPDLARSARNLLWKLV